MKIRCIAVDDEPMALEKLRTYIERVPYLELVGLCTGTYEAMNILSSEKVDAMFIDINMPDVNGLEFVKTLADPPLTVFTTAYSEYAVDSYKVRAVDYLLKPFGFADFQTAASNIQKHFSLLHPNADSDSAKLPEVHDKNIIFLKVDYRYVRVELDDIIYVEGMNEYLKIHQRNEDPLLTHTTFKQIKSYLPDTFIQIHRSYVVNMRHVKEVERSLVQMSNGVHLPVSESYKDAFVGYVQTHSLKK